MADDLIVDLTNYKDRVGNRVVPGRYTVVVEDAESDTAKSGNPMVNLWLRVQGGEFDGATIVDRLVLTEKSLFRVVGFMQAIGVPTPRKRFKINIRQFIGKTLDIDVEDGDPYNGRVKSEVRGYMRVVSASTTASAGASDLDDLDTGEEPVESAAEAAEVFEDASPAAPTADTGAADPAESPQEDPWTGDKVEAKSESKTPDDASEIDEIDLDSLDLG